MKIYILILLIVLAFWSLAKVAAKVHHDKPSLEIVKWFMLFLSIFFAVIFQALDVWKG